MKRFPLFIIFHFGMLRHYLSPHAAIGEGPMTEIALLTALLPAVLAAAGLFALTREGTRPTAALDAARWATIGALVLAALAGVTTFAHGPAATPLLGAAGLGLQVALDPLSAVMILLIAFLGAIVVQFSRNYLDGDARQGPFTGWLCLTLAAVSLLVLAGNIAQVALGWVAISVFVNRLLLFYGDRPRARSAAAKKRVMASIGGVAILGAMAALYAAFGTGDIAAIAAASGTATAPVGLAAFLIVLAALLKSAAFPAHGWLVEVMETPTPVSALLHAGIVNAGGFVVIRFSDVLLAVPYAMHTLALLGGIAAAAGSLAMIAQSSVKVSLAWSTVAQMGFMLLQCGFGAFTAATLHIVAHSLWKAHAFLSSGSVVDLARAKPGAMPAPTLPQGLTAIAMSLVAILGMGWAFGMTIETKPALVVFGAVLALGLAHFAAQRLAAGAVLPAIASVAGVAALYFALQRGAEIVLTPTVPESAAVGATTTLLMAGAVAVFAGIALVQAMLPAWGERPALRRLRLMARDGFHADARLSRLIPA
jgi:NAD(P)H-quinone oxidoreductase subunit 5